MVLRLKLDCHEHLVVSSADSTEAPSSPSSSSRADGDDEEEDPPTEIIAGRDILGPGFEAYELMSLQHSVHEEPQQAQEGQRQPMTHSPQPPDLLYHHNNLHPELPLPNLELHSHAIAATVLNGHVANCYDETQPLRVGGPAGERILGLPPGAPDMGQMSNGDANGHSGSSDSSRCPRLVPSSFAAKLNKLNMRSGLYKLVGEFGLKENLYYGSIFLCMTLIVIVCFVVINNRGSDALSGTAAAMYDTDKQCKRLLDPSNGEVHQTGQHLGDRAIYTCANGWEIVGPEERVCQASGRWSNSEPYCKKRGKENYFFESPRKKSRKTFLEFPFVAIGGSFFDDLDFPSVLIAKVAKVS